MNILVVDDDIEVLSVLHMYLSTDPKHKITTALSGEVALRLAHQDFFDLYVSDMKMPGMSGLEFGTKLRKIHPETKIIFFSSEFNGEEVFKEDLRRIGNAVFIAKDFMKLLHLISKIMSTELI